MGKTGKKLTTTTIIMRCTSVQTFILLMITVWRDRKSKKSREREKERERDVKIALQYLTTNLRPKYGF